MRSFSLLLLGCFLFGCGSTGSDVQITSAKRVEIAKQAGGIAALSWLAISNPSPDVIAAVKGIVDRIRDSVKEYKQDGFVSAYPELEGQIGQLFPKPEDAARKLAAQNFAKTMLEELDALFKKHSDWKTLSKEVAGIVGAFLTGASVNLVPKV